MNKEIRDLAIALLDDQDGISNEAYGQLVNLLIATGNEDIIHSVTGVDNRFFITEEAAELLRAKA